MAFKKLSTLIFVKDTIKNIQASFHFTISSIFRAELFEEQFTDDGRKMMKITLGQATLPVFILFDNR